MSAGYSSAGDWSHWPLPQLSREYVEYCDGAHGRMYCVCAWNFHKRRARRDIGLGLYRLRTWYVLGWTRGRLFALCRWYLLGGTWGPTVLTMCRGQLHECAGSYCLYAVPIGLGPVQPRRRVLCHL